MLPFQNLTSTNKHGRAEPLVLSHDNSLAVQPPTVITRFSHLNNLNRVG